MGRSKDYNQPQPQPQTQNKSLGKSRTEAPSPKTPPRVAKIDPKNVKKVSKASDSKYVTSRMEITAVTINMSGRGVLGVTPKYKVDMVETFLKSLPDVIFLQVSPA